jgi:hypothetical protein
MLGARVGPPTRRGGCLGHDSSPPPCATSLVIRPPSVVSCSCSCTSAPSALLCGQRSKRNTTHPYRPLPTPLRSYRDGVGGEGVGGGDRRGDPNPDNERAALRQAVELLREAQAMAESQTRAELQQAWAADRAWSEREQEHAAADAEAAGAESSSPPSSSPDLQQERLALFFEEAGLRAYDAGRLARDVRRDTPELFAAPLRDLAARMAVLARAVPGVPAAELALRDARLLAVPPDVVVGCMVALVAEFPGRDAGQMILRCPRLVLETAEAVAEASAAAEDGGRRGGGGGGAACTGGGGGGAAAATFLTARVRDAMRALVRLHPSGEREVVAAAVVQEPAVLLRMRRYLDARLLDELPLEIQTAFVEADRGIGWLHKHWKRIRKEQQRAKIKAEEEEAGGGSGGGEAGAAPSSKTQRGRPLSDWRSVIASSPPLPPPTDSQSTLELDGPGSSPWESREGF